jgi:hypothetical protein
MLYRGKSSLFYIFSSFIGALLVASFFAYQNYRFSQFKFINFKDTILYTQNDIFIPKKDNYYMVIFSSKMSNIDNLLSKIPKNYPIIAIDFYQQKFKNRKNIIFLRAGTNTIIKIIQKFNIYEIPIYFAIKRYNKNLFKQDSRLRKLGRG